MRLLCWLHEETGFARYPTMYRTDHDAEREMVVGFGFLKASRDQRCYHGQMRECRVSGIRLRQNGDLHHGEMAGIIIQRKNDNYMDGSREVALRGNA